MIWWTKHRLPTVVASYYLWTSSRLATTTVTAMSTSAKVIDSHLHVWATAEEAKTAFPYAEGQEPPASLQNLASTSELLKRMDDSGVDGALIVQPINHKFDHSYVAHAIKTHPTRLKGMLLMDPSLSPDQAVNRLEDLALQGFVGVRFNPYLWPKPSGEMWNNMSTQGGSGLAVYKRCAELKMPVGVMCFQGLPLHYDDILQLLAASPETTLILDHFGFTGLDDEGNAAFARLLDLAKYPNVVIKISALFRLKDETPSYTKVKSERLEPLLKSFGADRLMFGTDFPFVLEQPESYKGMVQLTSSWLDDTEKDAVMGGTAEKLFGPWGSHTTGTSS